MLENNRRFIADRHGRVRRLHFIGIGGSGMGGIAEVMHRIGYAVSGSDCQPGNMTKHLSKLGITVHIGHAASHVDACDVAVTSSAVGSDNPEVLAARAKRIPIMRRAEMLAELMRFRQGIAVAGTHGKTTATSLIASLLAEGDLDPTFVIGGRLNSAGAHAVLGSSEYLVAEADESDASFLHLQPVMTVVTNIDADHMATYGGSFAKLRDTFVVFLQQLPFYGLAVLCMDDPVVRELLPELNKPVLGYGFSADADIRATEVRQTGTRTQFKVSRPNKPDWLDIALNLPGLHNVSNALAAIAIAYELGVPDAAICRGLQKFQGIDRRLQVAGEFFITPTADGVRRKVLFVDDYGHHPREISATLQAVYAGWPERRLLVVFQPHRYTRTRDLFADFVAVLSEIKHLVLLNVYSAGEAPIAKADAPALYKALNNTPTHGNTWIFAEHMEDVPAILTDILCDGDILLTLGAGSIGALAASLPGTLAESPLQSGN
ncbi:MAG: UDP-N-acetylmuramate--L-alanine ligase [Gammaproteobacteria bacterium]|nr:UDP-N-acetylmuramate--L-alanine ligase [Gammaproteobacteria bacterium]